MMRENAGKKELQGENTRNELASSVPTSDVVIFCVIGLLVFTVLYLGMSAAQDILAGTSIPTSAVLLCTSLPFFVATLLAPYVIPYVTTTWRVALMTLLTTSGILMLALNHVVALRLTGVCLISLGCGIAETSFLSFTAYFHQAAVTAYCGGTGSGFAFGPLYYTALTTWVCLDPKTVLITASVIPLVIAVLYFILHKSQTHETGVYIKLLSSDDEQELLEYSCKEKLMTVKRTAPLAVWLIVGVSFEYLTVQGVVTTLAFPNSPFSPRDHYQFYFFSFAFGELIGRSYPMLAYYFCNSFTVVTEKTWIFTCLMGGNLLFTILASWYRFVSSVWRILLVLFEHGIVAGALYVNTFSVAGKHEKDARGKEFSRAFATIGSGLGLSIAGFVGLVVETHLRAHCLDIVSSANREFCFTRQVNYGLNSTFSSC